MDEKTRLNLQRMVKEYGADDNTGKIRELRHSNKIREDVDKLLTLKDKYGRLAKTNKAHFDRIVHSQCHFLWSNYTNIFNRILKDELDMDILRQFLNKLKDVEEGRLDQHEASVEVGAILKKLYIDSAVRHEKHVEERDGKNRKKKRKRPPRDVSWSRFKQSGLLADSLASDQN